VSRWSSRIRWIVECDGVRVHDSWSPDLLLGSPTLDLQLNQPGEFRFTVTPKNPLHRILRLRASLIRVWDQSDGGRSNPLFVGRALVARRGADLVSREVICEGSLGFLADSPQFRPVASTDPATILRQIIANHNYRCQHRQFAVGTVDLDQPVTVTGSTFNIPSTLEEIDRMLLKPLGCYLWLTGEDLNVINMAVTPGGQASHLYDQPITIGDNIVTLSDETDASGVVTRIMPVGPLYGADGYPAMIGNVTGGYNDVYDQDVMDTWGTEVWAPVSYETNDPAMLMAAGTADIAAAGKAARRITIGVLDKHFEDQSFPALRPGQACKVRTADRRSRMLVESVYLSLVDPADCQATMGTVNLMTRWMVDGYVEAMERASRSNPMTVVLQPGWTAKSESSKVVGMNVFLDIKVESSSGWSGTPVIAKILDFLPLGGSNGSWAQSSADSSYSRCWITDNGDGTANLTVTKTSGIAGEQLTMGFEYPAQNLWSYPDHVETDLWLPDSPAFEPAAEGHWVEAEDGSLVPEWNYQDEVEA